MVDSCGGLDFQKGPVVGGGVIGCNWMAEAVALLAEYTGGVLAISAFIAAIKAALYQEKTVSSFFYFFLLYYVLLAKNK